MYANSYNYLLIIVSKLHVQYGYLCNVTFKLHRFETIKMTFNGRYSLTSKITIRNSHLDTYLLLPTNMAFFEMSIFVVFRAHYKTNDKFVTKKYALFAVRLQKKKLYFSDYKNGKIQKRLLNCKHVRCIS